MFRCFGAVISPIYVGGLVVYKIRATERPSESLDLDDLRTPRPLISVGGIFNFTKTGENMFRGITKFAVCVFGAFVIMPVNVRAATCNDGHYLTADGCVLCPAGSYCIDDIKDACPTGTYSTSGASKCITIDTGYYGIDCDIDVLVPRGYTQLEYIEGTGTQWIDTEYYVQENDEIGITGQMTNEIFLAYGNCWSTSATYFSLRNSGKQASTRFGATSLDSFWLSAPAKPIALYTDFTATNNKKYLTINDDIAYTYVNPSFYTPTAPTYLLHLTCPSVSTRPGLIKRWWVMRDGELVRNMIPARRDADGSIGMYDTITQRFYENAGTGAFVTGRDISGCVSQAQCTSGDYCTNGKRNVCSAGTYSQLGANKCTIIDAGYYGTNCDVPVHVPYGYTQLEYIANGGTSYIDTQFIATHNTSVEVLFHVANLSNSDATILGAAGEGHDDRSFEIYLWDGYTQINYGNKQLWATDLTMRTREKYLVKTNKNVLSITNVERNATSKLTVWPPNFTGPLPINLFRSLRLTTTTLTPHGAHAIYYVKLWDGDRLARNMIPARRNSDGAVGMYDAVDHIFYENSGEDKFITGPEVGGCESQTICTAGNWCTGGLDRGICVVGTWSDAGAASCTTCVNAPANSEYTTGGITTAMCPWVCIDGFTQTAADTCVAPCGAGFTTLRSSNGANAMLFSDKNTSPALAFEYNGIKCYADLVAGRQSGVINTEFKGQVYHTVQN